MMTPPKLGTLGPQSWPWRAAAVLIVALGLVLGLAGAALSARAASVTDITERLPRGWCGVYKWRGGELRQHFSIVFTDVRRTKDGRVEATGNGVIGVPGRRYPIKTRAVIDPKTLRIELWEIRDIPDTPDFTTDGSHVGFLTAGLRQIRAVWTQNKTGQKGDLRLSARPVTGATAKLCSEAVA